eukprot:scaffold586435_cov94-Attheya_sp.AAC.2
MVEINLQIRIEFIQKQAERGGAFDAPPIPFIPNESMLDDMETHDELTLLIDPKTDMNASRDKTYKLKAIRCSIATVVSAQQWESSP